MKTELIKKVVLLNPDQERDDIGWVYTGKFRIKKTNNENLVMVEAECFKDGFNIEGFVWRPIGIKF